VPELISISDHEGTGASALVQTLNFVVSQYYYVTPPDVAPQFGVSSPFTYSVAQGTAFTYTLQTTAGYPIPVLTSTSLPSGVTFVDNGDGTGTLSGDGTTAAGSYQITFTANNSVGSTPPTLVFDLVVATPPTFTGSKSVSYAAGSTISFTISATDTDVQAPSLALDSTLSGALKNLYFTDNGNGTGTLAGTLQSGQTGTYNLTFEADNSVGVATTEVVTITIPTVPSFTSANAVAYANGSTINFSVTATDTDSSPPVITATSGLTGLCSHLTLTNNGNGTASLAGTLNSGTGSCTIGLKATNTASQSTTQTLTLTVPTVPSFTSASSASYTSGSVVSFTVSATDTDTASPALAQTASFSGICRNLTFHNNGNGTGTLSGTLVSGTGSCALTFTATNSVGQVTTQAFTLEAPTAPVFTSATTTTGKEGSSFNFTITATDTDIVSPTIALETSLTKALKNLTFTNNGNGTATLSGTIASGTGYTGSYGLTLQATNSAGVSTTQTLTITISS
jgi:hypothetical protein